MLSKKLKTLGILLLIGVFYAIMVRYTSFCIPCFFNTITGLKCPSCGVTHIFLHLMNFDMPAAFHANPFLFVTAPILLLILVLNIFCNIKIRKSPITRALTITYLISLVIWAVVRNIMHI